MNPLTNVKSIQKLNQTELEHGIPLEKSWHQQYKDSAWIFFGGLSYDLTEGDVLCVFSQYGEVANLNLIRDHKTGKTKGFGFLCYEDQRSTILAVDNLNGIKLASRTIRVDHVEEYRVPKMTEDMDPERLKLFLEGCAPQPIPVKEDAVKDSNPNKAKAESVSKEVKDKKKKKKKKKKRKKEKKKSKKRSYSSSNCSSDSQSLSFPLSEEEKRRKKKKRESRKC